MVSCCVGLELEGEARKQDQVGQLFRRGSDPQYTKMGECMVLSDRERGWLRCEQGKGWMRMEGNEEFVQGGDVGHLCFPMVTKTQMEGNTRSDQTKDKLKGRGVIELLTRVLLPCLQCKTLMRCLFFLSLASFENSHHLISLAGWLKKWSPLSRRLTEKL